jgi:Big-like domain-containing protein/VCBS repeat protein/FG-GAP repeat protein
MVSFGRGIRDTASGLLGLKGRAAVARARHEFLPAYKFREVKFDLQFEAVRAHPRSCMRAQQESGGNILATSIKNFGGSSMLRRTISGLCFYLLLGGLLAHAGQFSDAPQYTVGTNPQAVAIADFNGDGIPDLAVVNTASNSVSILLGNGDGTFTAKACPNCTTGTGPYGIAVGNFGNGQLDLVVTNSSANSVSILLGNGDGTFQAPVTISTGAGSVPEGVAVGDFNGDGNLDFVVTDSGSTGTFSDKVGVFLNNGGTSGTSFAAQVTYSTGFSPVSVVVGNFHSKIGTDNILDLAVANKSNSGTISVFRGNSNGTFQGQLQYTVGGIPTSITAGDFNSDGYTDLAVASQPVSPSLQGTVEVLLGAGLGSFSGLETYNVGSSPGVSSSPTSVATGVFTTSGHLDLAVTAANDNTLNVLTGNGDGTFNDTIEARYGTGATPYSAVVATLIPNGKSDVVVANFGAASVSVLMGNGDAIGSFQSRVDYDSGPQPNSVVVGDFNNDGIPDLAFADGDCATPCTPNSISIILGNSNPTTGIANGTFGAQATFTTLTGSETDTDTYALVAADFNGDGNLDIAAVNNNTNNVVILLGNGDGTFQAPLGPYAVGTQPTGIAVRDFNGDGFPDLAVTNYGSNTVSVLLNKGDGTGTFNAAVPYNVGHGPYAIATANFNSSDTFPDLVVVNETDKTVSILLGNSNGTFQPAVTYNVTGSGSPSSVAIGDFNGDGKVDLAVGDAGTPHVYILLGNGDGSFQAATQVSAGLDVFSLVANSFTGSGHTDLALTGQSKTGPTLNLVSLLAGNGLGGFGTPVLFPIGSQASAESQSIAFGDFNADGAIDLAVANGLSSTASVLLNSGGTAMTITPSAGNPSYGAPVTFTASVSASVAGAVAPTGTVTFTSGSTTLGANIALTNGTASVTTSTLPVGAADPITAAYSGDTNFQPHSVSITENVTQAATTSVLLSSVNPSNLGQSVTLTATVCPSAGCPATATAPTGTVTFLDGTTSIGTGSPNASGVATLTTSALAAGTNSITASYGGDTNYLASVSPVLSQVVVGPGFTLAASPLSPSSVAAGASSTSTITITPVGGLSAANVVLSCSSILPAVTPAPTCNFGTITVTGGIGTATLTLGTTGPAPALKGRQRASLSAVWLLLPAAVFGSLFLPKPKRGKMLAIGLVALISAGCIFQAACGGGSGSKGTNSTPSASSTALASSANPSFTGQAVTFTANVTSSGGTPTGSVTFLDGSTSLGTGTLASGSATFQSSTLAAGTHTITAAYGGDTSFAASTSTAVSQVVNASTAANTYTITVQGSASGAVTQTTGLSLTVTAQ